MEWVRLYALQMERTAWTASARGRLTLVIRRSNSRRSFTTTATWHAGAASRLLISLAWPSVRSRSGFRTDGWSGRRTTAWHTRPPRRHNRRRYHRTRPLYQRDLIITTIIISRHPRWVFCRRSRTRTTFCRSTPPPNSAPCTAAVKNSPCAARRDGNWSSGGKSAYYRTCNE